jgi:hypothetical protein
MQNPKTNDNKFVFDFLQELSVALFTSICLGAGIGTAIALIEGPPSVETVEKTDSSSTYRVRGY